MTSPGGATMRPNLEDRSETVFAWVLSHRNKLLGAALGLGALALGSYFYQAQKATKEAQAERALMEAQRAVYSRNLPLAQADLQKVSSRFGGTDAADRAQMQLAQVLFDQGKYAEGLAALAKVDASGAEGAAVHALIAAGNEGAGKFREAAAEYRKAADAARFASDKSNYRAAAGRALMSAGDKAGALGIWTELSQEPDGGAQAEARVRLGELQAQTATPGS